MFENINILSKLYSLKQDFTSKEDIHVIENLITKYSDKFVYVKNQLSKKQFSMNAKTVNKLIFDLFFEKGYVYDKDKEERLNKFMDSEIYKDLVYLRFIINNKCPCFLKNTYRETLNIYTIEQIKNNF
jgi:hypothetical protein